MKFTKYTEQELRDAVMKSHNVTGVLRNLSMTLAGGNHKTVKNHIEKLQIDISHFTGRGYLKDKNNNWCKQIPLDEILIKGKFHNTHRLKQRLIKENFLEYKCYMEGCNITDSWNGKSLVLRLDHINGDNHDNRIENLRLLCPNCDSQSEFFCGKNKQKNEKKYIIKTKNGIQKIVYDIKPKNPTGKCVICNKDVYGTKFCDQKCTHIAQRRVNWPTKDELKQLITEKSFCEIGRIFGVSDNAVRKWAKNFGIL